MPSFKVVSLARLPSSSGISPVRLLPFRFSPVTLWLLTVTPCHRLMGLSVFQLLRFVQPDPAGAVVQRCQSLPVVVGLHGGRGRPPAGAGAVGSRDLYLVIGVVGQAGDSGRGSRPGVSPRRPRSAGTLPVLQAVAGDGRAAGVWGVPLHCDLAVPGHQHRPRRRRWHHHRRPADTQVCPRAFRERGGPAQPPPVRTEPVEAEFAHRGWHRSGEVVARQVQVPQFGEAAERRWDRSRQAVIQAVVVQFEAVQLSEAAELGGDRTRQAVAAQFQGVQLGEVAELGGDRTRQAVVVQVQVFESCEAAELRGDRTRRLLLYRFRVRSWVRPPSWEGIAPDRLLLARLSLITWPLLFVVTPCQLP